jgi:hypothetical protein
MRLFLAASLCGAIAFAAACGEDIDPAKRRAQNPDAPLGDDGTVPSLPTGSRRITAREYNRILADVLMDRVGAQGVRAEDTKTGFDNDIGGQPLASAAYIEEKELAAKEAALRFVANAEAYGALVPCAPNGPGDAVCFKQFVAKVGRRLLRHSLAPEDTQRYADALLPFAIEKNDFKKGVELAVRAMLQDTEFLYLVKTTRPIEGRPGVVALTGPARASSLSFYLWGTTPDDALLDKAEAGELDRPARVAEIAKEMIEDPRAKDQVTRFVAMWLGYERNPALTPEMAEEVRRLVERTVFANDTDFLALFSSTDTYLPNDALADRYGLPHPPAGGGFIAYPDGKRAGILSTGAALTMGAKLGDSSPTQRGKAILEKILCTPLARPANVNVDEPPMAADSSPCKVARYKAISDQGASCASCHAMLDGIGLGLENYDLTGKFREHDDGLPACTIPGDGNLPGSGAFKGPGELSGLLLKTGKMQACIVRQAFRYGLGREEVLEDHESLTSLATQFSGEQQNFKRLLVRLVSSSAFLTVKEQP